MAAGFRVHCSRASSAISKRWDSGGAKQIRRRLGEQVSGVDYHVELANRLEEKR